MKVQVLIFTDFTSTVTRNDYVRGIGAYRIASELRNVGFSVQVVDHFNDLTDDQITIILEKFVDKNSLFIGFSSTFCKFSDDRLHHISTVSKKINPSIKLVLGGANTEPLLNKHIDIFVKGYAESMILLLANELLKQQSVTHKKILGIDGNIKKVLDWDLTASNFDFQHSRTLFSETDFIQEGEVLPIEISRGCIFRCKFCAFPMNGRKKNTYIKHAENLHNELISNYEKYKTTHYMFADDTHNESVEKLEILHNIFTRLPFKIQYWTYLRHDLIYTYREMADILQESGLKTAIFGLETLNPKAAIAIGKGLHPTKSIELLEWLKEKWQNNIGTDSGFIAGLPHETMETLTAWTASLLDKNFPLDTIHITPLFLSRLPKTFSSEFELNPGKYGYVFPNERDPTYWETQHLNRDMIVEFVNMLREKLKKRNTIAGGSYPYGLKNLGFDFEKVRFLTFDIISSLPINNFRKKAVDKYYNQIISI